MSQVTNAVFDAELTALATKLAEDSVARRELAKQSAIDWSSLGGYAATTGDKIKDLAANTASKVKTLAGQPESSSLLDAAKAWSGASPMNRILSNAAIGAGLSGLAAGASSFRKPKEERTTLSDMMTGAIGGGLLGGGGTYLWQNGPKIYQSAKDMHNRMSGNAAAADNLEGFWNGAANTGAGIGMAAGATAAATGRGAVQRGAKLMGEEAKAMRELGGKNAPADPVLAQQIKRLQDMHTGSVAGKRLPMRGLNDQLSRQALVAGNRNWLSPAKITAGGLGGAVVGGLLPQAARWGLGQMHGMDFSNLSGY